MRRPRRRRRQREQQLKRLYPCTYTGPDNVWGLHSDTPCRVLGKHGLGYRIEGPDGGVWTVAKPHVQFPAVAA